MASVDDFIPCGQGGMDVDSLVEKSLHFPHNSEVDALKENHFQKTLSTALNFNFLNNNDINYVNNNNVNVKNITTVRSDRDSCNRQKRHRSLDDGRTPLDDQIQYHQSQVDDSLILFPKVIPVLLRGHYKNIRNAYSTFLTLLYHIEEYNRRIRFDVPAIVVHLPTLALPCSQGFNDSDLLDLLDWQNEIGVKTTVFVRNMMRNKKDAARIIFLDFVNLAKQSLSNNDFVLVRGRAMSDAKYFTNSKFTPKPIVDKEQDFISIYTNGAPKKFYSKHLKQKLPLIPTERIPIEVVPSHTVLDPMVPEVVVPEVVVPESVLIAGAVHVSAEVHTSEAPLLQQIKSLLKQELGTLNKSFNSTIQAQNLKINALTSNVNQIMVECKNPVGRTQGGTRWQNGGNSHSKTGGNPNSNNKVNPNKHLGTSYRTNQAGHGSNNQARYNTNNFNGNNFNLHSNRNNQGNLGNQSNQQGRALGLRKDIIITAADKGGGVFVLKTEAYKLAGTKIFGDTDNYKIFDSSFNPQKILLNQMKLNNIIMYKLLVKRHITSHMYKNATVPAFDFATAYLIFKTHKPPDCDGNFPSRPIVTSFKSTFRFLDKYIELLLFKLATFIPSKAKNSNDIIGQILEVPINLENSFLASLDIVSMFPSLSQFDLASKISDFYEDNKSYLQNLFQPFRITVPTGKFVQYAIMVILSNNIILFNGKYYKQIKGVAMGSSSSVILADLFIDDVLMFISNIFKFDPLLKKLDTLSDLSFTKEGP
ncbi:unnamed protein product, partial [Rotaria magnacalcarata]